eukprot:CAMPEP_0113689526 /NCGR_PEP_ID=MMETSP0038_2-20120614/17220_1 /TAXON_ID=2898 /ORGANISM="Cryptomonas paramecium" /LENGTH=521 /DNA_ID=CAMNT_0000610621 /DNA_START=28 /DNA_END=1590 /DNA_ORIENTATION=+ /assembly_acc=CAM_ASM_000170
MWRRTFKLFVCFCFGNFASGWHAFMGQEALPTLTGTNLEASLELPRTEFSATLLAPDNCSIAYTSFRKLAYGRSCSPGQSLCTLQCAAAWESFFRDFQDASQQYNETICQQALSSIQAWLQASNATSVPSDWTLLLQIMAQQLCMGTYGCSSSYCVLTTTTSTCFSHSTPVLRPTDCNDFTAFDGTYYTPFLTWLSFQYYQNQQIGGAGGLNLVSDDEHTTWACVYVSQCGLVPYDLTCFQYSFVRGEFHFWGYNSQLKLHPSIANVDMSYCSSDSILRIGDAFQGVPVGVSDVTFSWSVGEDIRYAGQLFNLGSRGCDNFTLERDLAWTLSVDKAGYYLWTGDFPVTSSSRVVSVPLAPAMHTTLQMGISVVLSWRYPQLDFDLWLVLSSPDWTGLDPLDDGHFAVNWRNPSANSTDVCTDTVCEQGRIRYGHDVTNGFGPESVQLSGALQDGVYSIYVQLYGVTGSAASDALSAGALPFVEVYSEVATGAVERLQAGSNTSGQVDAGGVWWHAMNLVVA